MAKKLTSASVGTMIKITQLFLKDTALAKEKYWKNNNQSSPQSDFYDTAESRAKELLEKLNSLHVTIRKEEEANV